MLTRSGVGAAATAMVLLVCGWWWGYEELVVIAACLLVLVAVALWSARVPHRADVQRRLTSPRVARGDPIRAVYRATNTGRRRSPAATIRDGCDGASIEVMLPAIPADERAEVVGLIPTRRRGRHTVGPWELQRVDPFGLAVGRRPSDVTGDILVHPRIHALTGPQGPMHSVEDESVMRRAASDPLSGFVSLREYVDGDDPRLIHWPTSARMGALMVREHVEVRRPEFTVVLDAAPTVATPDDFEEMVDVVASVAAHALTSGVDVRLRTTSRAHPGAARPLHLETQVLDLLTLVEQAAPDDVVDLPTIFRSGFDQTIVVLVTGPEGPSSTFTRVDRLRVVRVGLGATRTPGVALAADDAAGFAQRWQP